MERIVNSNSPEANSFDFDNGDGYLKGNIKFVWKELYCPECKIRIPVQSQKRYEQRTCFVNAIVWIKENIL